MSKDQDAEKNAEKYLKPLTDYVIEKIGNQTLAQTPLYLMATAGMRLKQKDDREQSDKIIQVVEKYLRKRFKSTSTTEIIEGKQEALYGWIAVNYMMGLLKEKDGDSFPTMGILELGGASTQIAYASSDPSPPDPSRQGLFTLEWGKTKYQIYRHSADELGQDKASDKIKAAFKDEKKLNPCYPNGYLESGDDYLGQEAKKYDICKEKIDGTILFKKIEEGQQATRQHRPPQGVFLAYSGYSYTYSHFPPLLGSLKPFLPLTELEEAGKSYCSAELKELKSYQDYNEKYWPKYCFTAAYIAALLQTGYGFPKDTQQIMITNTLHGNEISWTLGAMIYKQLSAKLP